MKHFTKSISTIFVLLIFVSGVRAQDTTTVAVRAKAKDAKFIGDGMGGAMITVQDAVSGDTLAHGLAAGSTGDTKRLVVKPAGCYDTLSTPGAAQFDAHLPISEPTLVTITAVAPYGEPQTRITASVQKWIIPGKDITGDGVILEIPGFAVSNEKPVADSTYMVNQAIPIRTHIVMMCGCPTEEGGLWDSSEYEIKAQIRRDDELIEEVPLKFTGETNFYAGQFTPEEPGAYKITVYSFHPETGNTGVDETEIEVDK